MPLLEGTSTDLSCKLSLTYEVNINHYNGIHHPLFTLLVGIGNTVAAFKKLFFQMSVQVFSFLGQNEREEEGFFREHKKGEMHCQITPKIFVGCYNSKQSHPSFAVY